MNAFTRMSAKGQVVIPKDVRDRLALAPGAELEVFETGDGVYLRRPRRRETITMEEAQARFAKIIRYDGPPVSIER